MKDEIDNSAKLGYNGILIIDIYDEKSDLVPALHTVIPREYIASISTTRIDTSCKNNLFEFEGLFRTHNKKGQELNIIIDKWSAPYMDSINEFMLGDFQILKLTFRSTGNKFKTKEIFEFQAR